MKKVLFLVAAMFALALPAAHAQKVNTTKELAKLEKADADVQDAKKGAKASTWLARGKAYADAYALPTKELLCDIPVQTLQMSVGQPNNVYESEFMGAPVLVCDYEYVDVYVSPNYMIVGWNQKLAIKENLVPTAIESLAKAYEMDPKLASKIAPVALNLSNALAQQGDALNSAGRVLEASEAFYYAYQALTIVPTTQPNNNYLYNAGMLMTMHAATLEGEEANAAFKAAEGMFNAALAAGYEDTEGNIYYFLFHCYYGQRNIDRIYLTKAKEALLTGIQKFPKNNLILDGLMNLYTAEEGVGDPAELISMIENSLKDDPTNYDLWFGRGRVFYALKDFDQSFQSFEKCVELRPNDFEANFYAGYLIIEKANAQVEALNANTSLSYDQYNEEYAKINTVYAEAIPWLERAFEINPNDRGTIEFLNNLCFRLREMDGIAEKYNKYHELFMNL